MSSSLNKGNRWASLYQASQEMSACLDLEALYVAIHNAVEKVMPCDDFIIDGYDETTNEVVPLYLIEPPRMRCHAPRYVADHGLAGNIIHSGEIIFLNSPEAIEASGIRFELYGSRRITQSLVAVPMRLRGKVIGMLSAQSYAPGAYTLEDQELLEVLASHAAITLENVRLFIQIKQLADTDPLTGIFNRRKFFELAELELARAKRYHYPLSAAMIDIDRFKQFNTRYGHQAGDRILQMVIELCRQQIRSMDILGRYGGEEFVLILPSTNLQGAVQIAERLRLGIEQVDRATIRSRINQVNTGSLSESTTLRLRISVGVAELDSSCTGVDILINHADQAMYQAKRAGRNRVEAWPAEHIQ